MSIRLSLENIPPHIDEAKVREAVMFYADTLLPKMRRRIDVIVQWTHSRALGPDTGYAEACWVENGNRLPVQFTIKLQAKMRGWRVYLYIAHEMVHVRQWATGDLIGDLGTGVVLWHGKKTSSKEVGMSYWDFPWEHEAMALEYGLFAKFKHKHGYTNNLLASVK